MEKSNIETIEVTGVEKDEIELRGIVRDFKVREILKVPKDTPTITTLINVFVSIENIKLEVFEALEAENTKGELLTGKKVFITGILVSNYKYITNQCIEKVKNIKFETPFGTYVNIEGDLLQQENFAANLYIQDIEVRAVGKRKIYQHVLIAANINNPIYVEE